MQDITYEPQDNSYGDIAKPYRRGVEIDFTVKHNNIEYWIECNGKQHYDLDVYYHITRKTKDKNDFIKHLNRDRCVRTYCKEHNIVFIEIPYTVRGIKKVRSILEDIIINGKNPEDLINLTKQFDMIRSYGVNPVD